jgi:hypothetical protein
MKLTERGITRSLWVSVLAVLVNAGDVWLQWYTGHGRFWFVVAVVALLLALGAVDLTLSARRQFRANERLLRMLRTENERVLAKIRAYSDRLGLEKPRPGE